MVRWLSAEPKAFLTSIVPCRQLRLVSKCWGKLRRYVTERQQQIAKVTYARSTRAMWSYIGLAKQLRTNITSSFHILLCSESGTAVQKGSLTTVKAHKAAIIDFMQECVHSFLSSFMHVLFEDPVVVLVATACALAAVAKTICLAALAPILHNMPANMYSIHARCCQ